MSTDPETIWSHCNECGQETRHDTKCRVDRRRTFDEDAHHSVDVGSVWKMLQCRGCEEVTLHRVDWCSEDFPDPDSSDPGTYFPPRVSRRRPAWVEKVCIPGVYAGLLDEIYVALHADSRQLAMMGVRALIDAVIRRSVGDHDNFVSGLTKLVDKQFISQRNREIIESAIEAGHASAHRGHIPSSNDVNVVIDIVENLIHNELLTEPAQALKSTTPQRKQAGKEKKAD